MHDENGTETSRSDEPGADKSPFADAPDETDAQVDEEVDSAIEQESQVSDDDGEHADAPEVMKVVLSIKGSRATIGVQRPSSDPYIESFDDDDVSGLALMVPAVIERARAQWEEAPKHPAYERPAAPARRQRRRQQETAQHEPAGTNDAEAQQQTLSLF